VNGIIGPLGSNNAVVGTAWPEPKLISGINLLKDRKKLNILNDGEPVGEVPITFNASGWGAEDLVKAMKKGFIIFEHSVHGDYNVFSCKSTPYFTLKGDNINSLQFISDKDLRDSIAGHKPFFITDSCHTGIITDVDGTNWNPEANDNLAWAIINAGASGYKALTSFGWSGYSDKLDGIYYSYLTKPTYTVGDSLKYAVTKYKPWWIPGFLFWLDPLNEVTLTEPVLYGVPWMTIDPPESLQVGQGSDRNDFKINISKPQYVASNTYKIIVEVNVTNYFISKLNSFDIIKINGSDETRANGMPILPMIYIPIALPKGSNASLSMVQNISTTIGYYNIPCFIAIRKGSNGSAVANCTNITGMVPVPSYGLYISDFDDYKEAAIALALVRHDPQTKKTVLYNYTKLELYYQTPVPVVITDFSLDKIEYVSGETINASVTVENVGSDNLTNLRANLSLKDPHGRIVASNEELFDIASGESRTIYVTLTPNVPHGIYLAELNILGSGVLASSSRYITINTGEIVNFTCASEVESGNLENFTISFRNGYQNSVKATGVVYIYDSDYIRVGEVYSAPVQIPANATYDIKISWDTTGKDCGKYTASAVVLIENEQFGPEHCSFEIKPKPAPVPPPPPPIVKPIVVPAPFNFTLEISPSSDAAQQGVSKQVKITVNLVSGSSELVSLKATGIPPNASGEFSNSSGYPTFTSILTISTSESTPPGTYTIKIEAEGGLLKREAVYTLDVIPKIPQIQYFMGHLGNLSGKTVVYRKVIEGKAVEVLVDYRTIIKYEKTGYCGFENMPPAYSIDDQARQWKAGYSKNRMYYGVDGCWYWVYFPATYRG
jgi:hypothetical protein